MKCLLASALATLAGLGWFGYQPEDSPEAACTNESICADMDDCDVTVECLPDGTCLIECDSPAGSCWVVLDCNEDGECEVIDCGGDACEGLGAPDCEMLQGCDELPDCAKSKADVIEQATAPAGVACCKE